MTLWIWLGAGFAIGLLALVALTRLISRPAASLPAVEAEPPMAELVRAQMKVAILQDRLERATTEFEHERAARDQALQLRLAATEAAYQRQMLAMQPRLNGAVAETPVQINIRVEAGTAVAARTPPEPLAETYVDPQEAFILADSNPQVREPGGPEANVSVQGVDSADSLPAADDDPGAAADQVAAKAEEGRLNEAAEVAATLPAQADPFVPEETFLANGVVEEPLLLAASVAELPHKTAAPPEEPITQAMLLDSAPGESEAAFAAPLSSALGETEEVILDEASVARFLAVAGGAVDDPHDGIEAPVRPIAVAHDDPPAIPDAPLDDMDELPEREEPSLASQRSIVPPWQDELDADYADDEEWVPVTTVTAVESEVTARARASRWEVLPRQEDEMANLDYLDSGVFAVPALPGWGKETAVAETPHSSMSRAAAVPASEPLPDPADALSWLDDLGEEALPAARPVDEAALIEAKVAEVLAGDPASVPAAQTVDADEWATVVAILARGVEAGMVDMTTEALTMEAADLAAQSAVEDPDPPFEWQRRPIAWDAHYFDNIKLTGEPVLVRQDREIDFDWGPQAPAAGISAGQFSVRWSGVLVLDPGLYHFTLAAPDGIRLWLNERLVLSAWYDQSLQEYAREFDWQGGSLYVRCEHYEHGPEAQIHFTWERIA